MAWVSYFDNTKWQAVSGAEWTGSSWSLPLTGGVARSQLEVIGTWYKNYFPKKVRLTISDDNSTLNVRSSGGLILASASPYVSGAEIDMTFATSAASAFINRIDLDWGVSPSATYQIDDIEFHDGSSSSSSFSSCTIDINDDFTGTNGDDPDLLTWSIFTSGGSDGPEIQSNALRCSVGSGYGVEGVQSNYQLQGNFDVRVNFNIVAGADIGTQGWNGGLEVRFSGDPNNIARMGIDGHTTTYIGASKVSGVDDGDASPTPETSGSFRVTRSGSTFNCYYEDSGWQLLHTKSIGASAVQVRLYNENETNHPLGTIDFDNLEVVAYDDVICASSSSSSSSSESSSSSTSNSSSSSSSSSSISSSSSSESSSSSSESSSSSSSSSSESSSSSSSSSSLSSSSSSSSQCSSSSSSSSSSSESSSSSSSESSSSSSSSLSSSSSSSSSFFDASRTHFWHYVLDSEGRPIQNAQIRLYLEDDPTTEANIYLTEVIATYTTTSVADILTDNDGFFEFWLGSEWEEGGYPYTQTFRLEWYKAGTAPGIVTDINPWPNAFSWQDTNQGADKDHKNKFVSDFLANKWWTHLQQFVPSASPHDLHPVDVTKGCAGSDNRYNKVVSNKFMNDIITWSNAEGSEAIISEGVNEHQEDITSWSTSSGVYYKDVVHSGIGSKSVTVQIAKLSDFKQIQPKKLINLSSSTTRIVMDSDIDVRVNIQGSSSSISSSSSVSSSSSFSQYPKWSKREAVPQQPFAVGMGVGSDLFVVGMAQQFASNGSIYGSIRENDSIRWEQKLGNVDLPNDAFVFQSFAYDEIHGTLVAATGTET